MRLFRLNHAPHRANKQRHRIRLAGFCLLILSASHPSEVRAETVPQSRFEARDPHAAFVTEASRRFGIPEHWIRAVRRIESADNVRALSTAGAMGLMQIMPGTWHYLRDRHGLGDDPYDPRDNLLAGTAYLREMYDRYGFAGFLAAYNAGPGRYEAYLKGRPLQAETRSYVARLAPLIKAGNLPSEVMEEARNDPPDPHIWQRATLFVRRSPTGERP